MAANGKKGITVKVDEQLHAEVTQYLQSHGMTMSEFVTIALQDELHPKYDMKEGEMSSESYDKALCILGDYVNITSVDDMDEECEEGMDMDL